MGASRFTISWVPLFLVCSFSSSAVAGKKMQEVSGRVTDSETGNGIPSATIQFRYVLGAETFTANSRNDGGFVLVDKVPTDPDRPFQYEVTIAAGDYETLVLKVPVRYDKKQACFLSFPLKKKLLPPPEILLPRKTCLSLRPTIKWEIGDKPGSIDLKGIALEIATDKAFQKLVYDKNLLTTEIASDENVYSRKLEAGSKLKDSATYYLRIKATFTDGRESNWTTSEFEIPNSQTLSPPLPENVVTSDGKTNTQPAWLTVDKEVFIAFASNRNIFEDYFQIWLAPLNGGGSAQVTTNVQESIDSYPVMGPGDQYLTFVSNRVGKVYNLWSVPLKGPRFLIQRTTFEESGVLFPTVSRGLNKDFIVFVRRFGTGKEKAAQTVDSIWLIDQAGARLVQLTRGSMPKISIDGKSILYVDNSGGNQDIWRIQVDGQQKTQITSSPENEEYPDWVDQSRIVYSSDKSENRDIWLLDLATKTSLQLTNNLADETMPTCSPDGKVAFVSDRGKGFNIYWIDLSSVLNQDLGKQ